jgi:Domain of unknown function (DUF5076)
MSNDNLNADELDIPIEAFGNPNASEVLRAWSIDGGLVVSLNPMAFADSSVWGFYWLTSRDTFRELWRMKALEVYQ